MSKRPRIRWQESQNAGKSQSGRLSGGILALHILYAALLSLLFLFATARIFEDGFGPLLMEGDPGYLWGTALFIPIILAWNETLYNRGKNRRRLVGSLVLLAAALWGAWYYYREHGRQLIRGCLGLAQRYLDAWNSYYLTSLEIEQPLQGSRAEEQLAGVMLLALGMILLQTLSAMLRKRSVLLLLPVGILGAEMMVGLTPGWPGMACLFGAGVLGLHLDCHRRFQAAASLVLAFLMALLLPLNAALLEKPASRMILMHDRLQDFQHRMEQEIQNYDWQSLLRPRRRERLDNRRPEYTQKEILTVTVSQWPANNLYLRGYYGTEYQEGSWDAGEKEFERACRRYGMDAEEGAKLLAGLGSSARADALVPTVQYRLEYTGQRGRAVYLPYEADLETAGDDFRVRGDYLAEKARSLESLTVEGYIPGSLVLQGTGNGNPDVQGFYSWYNEYVTEHYLAVPGEMPELTQVVNSLARSDACMAAREELNNTEAAGRNLARLLLGNLVAQELRGRARYSIDPGSLPVGVDPVEYFLGENRQGYCMHFATAGVLILRQLGVPARYVSGYVATPDQFRQTSEGYTASVKDNAAHAWVEIWLELVGWVPVEMTPGYGEAGDMSLIQEQHHTMPPSGEPEKLSPDGREDWEQASSDHMEIQDAGKTPIPSTEPTDSAQENGRGGKEPGGTGPGIPAADLQSPEDSDLAEGWGFAGEGGWAVFGQNGRLRVSHAVLAGLGVLTAAWLTCLAVVRLLRRRTAWWEKIREDMEKGSAGRAIKVLNRRLYKRLKRRRAGILTLRSDREYLEALCRQYPRIPREEWENYMEVVQKAVYSQEEIGPEQARGCYNLLRRAEAREASGPRRT